MWQGGFACVDDAPTAQGMQQIKVVFSTYSCSLYIIVRQDFTITVPPFTKNSHLFSERTALLEELRTINSSRNYVVPLLYYTMHPLSKYEFCILYVVAPPID